MKAITIRQPWASQIFDEANPKTIENRSRLMPHAEHLSDDMEFIAIHAGGAYVQDAPFPSGVPVPSHTSLPYSAIIGIVRVVYVLDTRTDPPKMRGISNNADKDLCLKMRENPWWIGPVGWMLMDAIAIKPIKIGGLLGVWKLPHSVHEQIVSSVISDTKKKQLSHEPVYIADLKDELEAACIRKGAES